MQALKINPYDQTVVAFDFDGSEFSNMYTELSSKDHPIDIFERVLIGPGHYAYIDESGALPHHNPTHYWKLPTTDWIAGMAIILGDKGEDWAGTNMPPEVISDFIDWGTKETMTPPSTRHEVIGFDSVDDLMAHLTGGKPSGD